MSSLLVVFLTSLSKGKSQRKVQRFILKVSKSKMILIS